MSYSPPPVVSLTPHSDDHKAPFFLVYRSHNLFLRLNVDKRQCFACYFSCRNADRNSEIAGYAEGKPCRPEKILEDDFEHKACSRAYQLKHASCSSSGSWEICEESIIFPNSDPQLRLF